MRGFNAVTVPLIFARTLTKIFAVVAVVPNISDTGGSSRQHQGDQAVSDPLSHLDVIDSVGGKSHPDPYYGARARRFPSRVSHDARR